MCLFHILLDKYHTASSLLIVVASPAEIHIIWPYSGCASNIIAGSAPRRKHVQISQSLSQNKFYVPVQALDFQLTGLNYYYTQGYNLPQLLCSLKWGLLNMGIHSKYGFLLKRFCMFKHRYHSKSGMYFIKQRQSGPVLKYKNILQNTKLFQI